MLGIYACFGVDAPVWLLAIMHLTNVNNVAHSHTQMIADSHTQMIVVERYTQMIAMEPMEVVISHANTKRFDRVFTNHSYIYIYKA